MNHLRHQHFLLMILSFVVHLSPTFSHLSNLFFFTIPLYEIILVENTVVVTYINVSSYLLPRWPENVKNVENAVAILARIRPIFLLSFSLSLLCSPFLPNLVVFSCTTFSYLSNFFFFWRLSSHVLMQRN